MNKAQKIVIYTHDECFCNSGWTATDL